MYDTIAEYALWLASISNFGYEAFKIQVLTRFKGTSEDIIKLAYAYYETLKGR